MIKPSLLGTAAVIAFINLSAGIFLCAFPHSFDGHVRRQAWENSLITAVHTPENNPARTKLLSAAMTEAMWFGKDSREYRITKAVRSTDSTPTTLRTSTNPRDQLTDARNRIEELLKNGRINEAFSIADEYRALGQRDTEHLIAYPALLELIGSTPDNFERQQQKSSQFLHHLNDFEKQDNPLRAARLYFITASLPAAPSDQSKQRAVYRKAMALLAAHGEKPEWKNVFNYALPAMSRQLEDFKSSPIQKIELIHSLRQLGLKHYSTDILVTPAFSKFSLAKYLQNAPIADLHKTGLEIIRKRDSDGVEPAILIASELLHRNEVNYAADLLCQMNDTTPAANRAAFASTLLGTLYQHAERLMQAGKMREAGQVFKQLQDWPGGSAERLAAIDCRYAECLASNGHVELAEREIKRMEKRDRLSARTKTILLQSYLDRRSLLPSAHSGSLDLTTRMRANLPDMSAAWGNSSPELIQAISSLASFEKRLGRKGEALRLYQRGFGLLKQNDPIDQKRLAQFKAEIAALNGSGP